MRSASWTGQEFEKKKSREESRLYLEAFKGQEEEEQRVQCLWENSEPHLICTM